MYKFDFQVYEFHLFTLNNTFQPCYKSLKTVSFRLLQLFLLLLIVLLQLFEKLSLGLHDGGLVAPALGAEPFPLRLGNQLDAAEVEPFHGAEVVVAPHHLAVRDLLANTVDWLKKKKKRFAHFEKRFYQRRLLCMDGTLSHLVIHIDVPHVHILIRVVVVSLLLLLSSFRRSS